MKFELIKETKAITGEVVYYVNANGHHVGGTTALDEVIANAHFERITTQAKLYHVGTKETIREEEV